MSRRRMKMFGRARGLFSCFAGLTLYFVMQPNVWGEAYEGGFFRSPSSNKPRYISSAFVIADGRRAIDEYDITPNEAIPPRPKPPSKYTESPPFKSWSLFLICNPAWLLPDREDDIRALYARYRTFGKAIGDKHLAIWFRKEKRTQERVQEELDVERSAELCAKFRLLPSESPHVLVTTKYPGLAEPLGNYFVLKLRGLKPKQIEKVLAVLADQLVVTGLRQDVLDSKVYWRSWEAVFQHSLDKFSHFLKKVRFLIDTKYFKVELGSSDNA